MQYKDYYKVMGLDKSATGKEIKTAYRKLARKYHPDVSKATDAENRFKEIGEAYEVLKNKDKRAAYDELGSQWQAGDSFTPPPDWEQYYQHAGQKHGHPGGSYSGFENVSGEDFSDLFSSIFGQASRTGNSSTHGFHQSRSNSRGEDVHAKVDIDVEDAYRGSERMFSFSLAEHNAQGKLVKKQKTLNIKIPKGVKEGQNIRLAKQGGSGYGTGAKGDLFLEIAFKPHKIYQVLGKDVTVKLPLSPWEAALGCKVEVPTPNGSLAINIAANSKAGQKLRLKAKGIPTKVPGDLFVVIDIVNPPVNTKKQKQAYQQLSESFEFQPRSYFEESANV